MKPPSPTNEQIDAAYHDDTQQVIIVHGGDIGVDDEQNEHLLVGGADGVVGPGTIVVHAYDASVRHSIYIRCIRGRRNVTRG